MRILFLLSLVLLLLTGCQQTDQPTSTSSVKSGYFDYSGKPDQLTGGITMVPIETAKGTFRVYTKRMGNHPTMRVLLLHGGPGTTHEQFLCFDGYFPNEEIEYIYYDQLDSHYSDKPGDSTLWTISHYVEEVEQVRKALGLNKDNFYLFGQSWGGILAMEYALKYQQNLKGLIVSNMMASAPAYSKYANEVLGPMMEPAIYQEIMAIETAEDFSNPRYSELLMNHYYTEHILRKPVKDWPEPVLRMFNHLSPGVYVYMQGHSEFGMTGNATLKNWDISDQLKTITVPTLVIGATYDTMDPKHMEWMSNEFPDGQFLLCENGSHLCQYDDPQTFFTGLIQFIRDVDQRKTK